MKRIDFVSRYVIPLFASMSLLVSLSPLVGPACAETKGEPITVVSHVDIIPDAYMAGAEENAARLFRAETVASQKEEGLVSYVVFEEIGSTNHFTIVETWHDARVYALHVGSPHTVQFRQSIQPYLGSPFDARTHRQFH